MIVWIKKEWKETELLLRCIPATVVSLFVVSVICMNLLANKTLLQTNWIALDGGILISWLSFMCMDIITKHFGPKASTLISIHAVIINLLTCLIFYIVSAIPSTADDYTAFDSIFGGTWFILLGSTVAFLASAVAPVLPHSGPHGKRNGGDLRQSECQSAGHWQCRHTHGAFRHAKHANR